jgi:ribosomal protein L24E
VLNQGITTCLIPGGEPLEKFPLAIDICRKINEAKNYQCSLCCSEISSDQNVMYSRRVGSRIYFDVLSKKLATILAFGRKDRNKEWRSNRFKFLSTKYRPQKLARS